MKRRNFLAIGGVAGLAACQQQGGLGGLTSGLGDRVDKLAPTVTYQDIDQKSLGVRNQLFAKDAGARRIASAATAYLIIPEVTKGGLFFGGAYGNGTMYQDNNVIGHYSLTGVSVGFQAGVQSFSFAMFFMTPAAYTRFQQSLGLEFGVDAEYALPRGGVSIGEGSQTFAQPVYALVFNQAGLMAGASIEGAKFTRF